MTSSTERPKSLTGLKVVLRQKQLTDAQNDYTWATDRELVRLDAAEPSQISFHAFAVAHAEGLRDLTKKQFAIETADGRHIGNCVCYNIDAVRKEAEIGIMIGERDCWGKGYGSDAVRTLIQYAFDDLGIEKLWLHTLEWNIRAQECFQSCGFTPVGRIFSRGLEFVRMEVTAHASQEPGNSPH